MLSALIVLTMLGMAETSHARDFHDAEQLEAFVDGVVHTSMRNHHVAGAVVTLVADGEVILSKGYGYSDVEKQAPVDPERTLFRIASITKLLTWTSLMQLKEQGKLDLDTDINEYLAGIEIPATFESPITIRHLMSHTPGLEDHVIRLFSRDVADMRPYLEILNDELPRRMRTPGDLPAYSNHGTALAGVIVEQVSGLSWVDYVEANILDPLDMEFTTVRQPVPDELAPYMSQGYKWDAGRFQAQAFEYVPLAPAGGASSSAASMARLLQAYLNGGELDGARILRADTWAEMQQSLYRADPRLNSALHGFYESSRHGQRIIGHGGATIWFHSEFMVLPELNAGFFISTNSEEGWRVYRDFINGFLERFYPYDGLPEIAEFDRTELDRVVGNYANLRSSFTDFTQLGRLMANVEISANEEGQLVLLGFGDPQYFVEIDSGLYQRLGQDQTIAFRFDQAGQATHFFLKRAPMATFQRVSWLYAPPFQQGLVAVCIIVFLWVLVAWPVQRFSHRWQEPKALRHYRTTAWTLALVVLLLNIGFVVALEDPIEIAFGVTNLVRALLIVNLAVPLLTLALAGQVLWVVRELAMGNVSRYFHFAVLIAGLAYCWFLYTWKLFNVFL